MHIAHEKLDGLDRDRVVAVVEPVLRAHGVQAVELIWRTDGGGWVLYLTVEREAAEEPAAAAGEAEGQAVGDSPVAGAAQRGGAGLSVAGVSLDLCAEISRDLSAALDVADVIGTPHRLEVGSPGLDRALYAPRDYARFAGRTAKLKLSAAVDGKQVVRGTLEGVDAEGRVLVRDENGALAVPFEQIRSGHLVFEWKRAPGPGARARQGRRARERGTAVQGR